jgi:hypothetical protein
VDIRSRENPVLIRNFATQAIRGGVNREVLNHIKKIGDIFFAESDRDWPQEPIFPAQKNQIRTLPFRAGARRLDRFQVLDQVVLFLLGQPQFEDTIVVVDDVGQGRESAVMVEPPAYRKAGARVLCGNDYRVIASLGNRRSRFLERCADSNPAGKSVAA